MSTRRLLGENLTSAGVVNGVIQDDWDQIIKICKAGRAQDFYSVGDTKAVSFGSEGTVNMILNAFDRDLLADRSGFANTTWIPDKLLKSDCRNFCLYGSSEFNKFENSPIYKKCEEAFDLLPPSLQNGISPVLKCYITAKSTLSNQYYYRVYIDYAECKIWLPSICETKGYPWAYPTLKNAEKITAVDSKSTSSKGDAWFCRDGYVASSDSNKNIYTLGAYADGSLVGFNSIYGTAGYLCPCFCL